MKTLKLEHQLALDVLDGRKTSTWRLFDDKDISVNDEVRFVDKLDPQRPETWHVIGTGMINRVIQKRFGDIVADDMEGHETYTSPDEMLTTYRGYYGSDVTLATTVKIIHFTFNPTQQGDIVTATTLFIENLKIYTDGGSRGNPGPSALGYVIVDPATDKVIVDKGMYLGVTTNNQAEYLALKYALEEAHKMGARQVSAYLDSLLVVNQMNGSFKVSNRDLWPIHDAIKQLLGQFKRVTFTHIPRELNKLADAAVNRALDEQADGLNSVSTDDTGKNLA